VPTSQPIGPAHPAIGAPTLTLRARPATPSIDRHLVDDELHRHVNEQLRDDGRLPQRTRYGLQSSKTRVSLGADMLPDVSTARTKIRTGAFEVQDTTVLVRRPTEARTPSR